MEPTLDHVIDEQLITPRRAGPAVGRRRSPGGRVAAPWRRLYPHRGAGDDRPWAWPTRPRHVALRRRRHRGGLAVLVGLDLAVSRPVVARGRGAALDAPSRPDRRDHDRRLLHHLPGLPQPQERGAAAAARRAVRPPAPRHRPRVAARPRPRRAPAPATRDRHAPTVLSPIYMPFFAVHPVVLSHRSPAAPTSGPGCSPPPRCRPPGCSARPATSSCRRSGRLPHDPSVRSAAGDPGDRPPGPPDRRASRVSRTSRATRGPPRASARSPSLHIADLLHRRARDPHARPPRRGEEWAWVLTPDRHRDDLLRLALPPRRRRGMSSR